MKSVIIIAIAFVLLIPVNVFAESVEDEWTWNEYQKSFQKLIEKEEYDKALKMTDDAKWYFGVDKHMTLLLDEHKALSELSRHQEALDVIREFNKKIESSWTSNQIKYGFDYNSFKVREASSLYELGKYSSAIKVAEEAIDDISGSAGEGNVNTKGVIQFAYKIIDSSNDRLEGNIPVSESVEKAEPTSPADEQYKMICSAPDGYCMERHGMNNPDAYGECLGTWVPFCRTYEAKQTQPEPQEPPHDADLDGFTPPSEIVCGKGTIEKNGQCVLDTKSSKGGGCLIATATYGSELAPQVQQLREIRDNSLLQTESGTSFMNTFNDVYYSFSPSIADYERENPVFREAVKLVITPMITSLSLMEYADSEESVLGIGISLLMLNLGMYVGIPVVAIMRLKKNRI